MNRILNLMSRLVTARPYGTISVLVVITIVLGIGASLRAELDETDGYFPRDNPVARALDEIDEIASDPELAMLLTPTGPIAAPSLVIETVLLGESYLQIGPTLTFTWTSFLEAGQTS